MVIAVAQSLNKMRYQSSVEFVATAKFSIVYKHKKEDFIELLFQRKFRVITSDFGVFNQINVTARDVSTYSRRQTQRQQLGIHGNYLRRYAHGQQVHKVGILHAAGHIMAHIRGPTLWASIKISLLVLDSTPRH